MSNGAMKFRANGQTVNTVVDPRFGLGQTPQQPSGWGTGGGEVVPIEGSSPGIMVNPSGDTTGATDTTAIQAALNQATQAWTDSASFFQAAEPVDVMLLGAYWINQPLVVPDGVNLKGFGWMATSIHLATGSDCTMVILDGWWNSLQKMQLDGHFEQQTPGIDVAGVHMVGQGVQQPTASCSAQLLHNVLIAYVAGSSFTGGGVEAKLDLVFSFRAQKHGFSIGASDMWVQRCISGESKRSGFLITGGAHHISDCKSWWSGFQGNDRTKTTPKTSPAPDVSGWEIRGSTNMITGCDSQDSAGPGWLVGGFNNQMRVTSDSNTGHHLRIIGGQFNDIELNIGWTTHWNESEAAVHLWGNNEIGNRIKANWTTVTTHSTNLPTVKKAFSGSAAAAQRNDIVIGTPSALVPTPYAATITPDPVFGGVETTLTGNVTITNPAVDRTYHGCEFSIRLTQDATGGRTVTFGSGYAGASPATTTAGTVNVWTFRCIGTKWVQVGFVSY